MWAQLGDVVFDILTAPDSFEASNTWDYAEHKIVGAKPKLQHTGQGLEEISLGYSLHVTYADPKASLDKLKEAAAKKEPLALMMGSGEYRGRYVITALSETWGHTRPDGNPLAITGRLTIKEHVGDTVQPLGEANVLPGQIPATALDKLDQAVLAADAEPWLYPGEIDEAEAALYDMDITPVEFPDAHNVLEKTSELSGLKTRRVISGVMKVASAAANVGSGGVGGLITSASGLLVATGVTGDVDKATRMNTEFLKSSRTSQIWSAMEPAMRGDFYGAAAKSLKGLAGGKLDKLAQYFPVSEAEQMARTLVTRLPVYQNLRSQISSAASREAPLSRALFAQPRSYAWMRDLVRFPTS